MPLKRLNKNIKRGLSTVGNAASDLGSSAASFAKDVRDAFIDPITGLPRPDQVAGDIVRGVKKVGKGVEGFYKDSFLYDVLSSSNDLLDELFGERVYDSNVIVLPLMEDGIEPNIYIDSLMETFFQGGTVSSNLHRNTLNGPFRNFDNYHSYTTENLEENTLVDEAYCSSMMQANLKRLLEEKEGISVDIMYAVISKLDLHHLGWSIIFDEFDYNPDTRIIEKISDTVGRDVYLRNILPAYNEDDLPSGVVPDPLGESAYLTDIPGRYLSNLSSIQNHGFATHIVFGDYTGIVVDFTSVQARLESDLDIKELRQESAFIPLSDYPYSLEEVYLQAKYTFYRGGKKHHKFLTYKVNNDDEIEAPDFPNINDILDGAVGFGDYFPVVYVAMEGEFLRNTHADYDKNDKALQNIGLGMRVLQDTIKDGWEDSQEYEKVYEATVVCGINFLSDNEVDVKYLYGFFSKYFDLLEGSNQQASMISLQQVRKDLYKGIAIGDGRSFNVSIGAAKVSKEIVRENIGPIGTYKVYDGSITIAVDGNARVMKLRTFRKQVTDHICEDIVVIEPRMVISNPFSSKFDQIINLDDKYARFVIPLDRGVLETMSIQERTIVCYRSLHVFVTMKDSTKMPWYAGSTGKVIIISLAIVISIYSGQWQLLFAAFAVGAVAFTVALVKIILVGMLAEAIFAYVAREIGAEWALIIALVISIYVIGSGVTGGEGGMGSVLFADDLLFVANGLIKGAEAETQRRIDKYDEKNQSFLEKENEAWEELREIEESLKTGIDIDPFMFTGFEPRFIPGETAEEYYFRLTGLGNIGTISLDVPDFYYDAMLTLPDFKSMYGDNNHV